ncbi:nucleotidyltransferase family protein [Methanospirillum lacunae]|uniref:protein adenylyltransferase n=1 Tax=Methanospirillum lacunae TaxID=668570 RepID=A0A2V2N0K7_9EURY|nr:nucleotidyltransferase family protein [Methanospirillum lacunae]PWR69707.1 nucleotidyltransferase [Methanospirillum lacunae]
MSMYDDVIRRKEAIQKVAAIHGARKIRIFGSVIRGEDTPESDLDLLVEFEPGRSLIDHIALIQDLQDLLERNVDVVTENGLNTYIRDQIIQEAIPL